MMIPAGFYNDKAISFLKECIEQGARSFSDLSQSDINTLKKIGNEITDDFLQEDLDYFVYLFDELIKEREISSYYENELSSHVDQVTGETVWL